MKKHVRTVIISDVHLGTVDSKADEVNHFLKHVRCDKLILNGDIIDGWQLRRRGSWKKAHTRFVRIVLKKMEKRGTEVIYLRGNHDDILASFLPLQFENLHIVEDHVHEGPAGRYLVLHGDIFDTVTKNFVFLAHLGDWGYGLLLRLNRLYNAWRAWRGKEYFSLSQAIKGKVKSAVSFISSFEEHLQTLAARRGCDGVMCGHIHKAEMRDIEGITYINDGDWVENCSMLYEDSSGHLRVGFHHMKANAEDVLLGSIRRDSAGVTFDKAA